MTEQEDFDWGELHEVCEALGLYELRHEKDSRRIAREILALRKQNEVLKDSLVAAQWLERMYVGPPDKGNIAAVLTEMHSTLRGMMSNERSAEREEWNKQAAALVEENDALRKRVAELERAQENLWDQIETYAGKIAVVSI